MKSSYFINYPIKMTVVQFENELHKRRIEGASSLRHLKSGKFEKRNLVDQKLPEFIYILYKCGISFNSIVRQLFRSTCFCSSHQLVFLSLLPPPSHIGLTKHTFSVFSPHDEMSSNQWLDGERAAAVFQLAGLLKFENFPSLCSLTISFRNEVLIDINY